jgi:hypothetical protein
VRMLQRLSLGSPRKIAACSELDAAREIQRSLLPQKTPAIKKYSIGFRSSACFEVGGDYLDVFALPSGEEVMIVADVAGKGPRRGSCRGPRSGSVANRNACIKENCAENGPGEKQDIVRTRRACFRNGLSAMPTRRNRMRSYT